jgi:5-methylcytosine-specific restriction endonuclease McrA
MTRSTKDIISKKIENFRGNRDNYKKKKPYISKPSKEADIKTILKNKIIRFHRDKKLWKYPPMTFKVKDLLDKIGENPTCYLTGRPINLMDGQSYHLDHIIPKNKGGENSIENCNIACRDANQAKGNLLYQEFILLCEEILSFHKQNKVNI